MRGLQAGIARRMRHRVPRQTPVGDVILNSIRDAHSDLQSLCSYADHASTYCEASTSRRRVAMQHRFRTHGLISIKRDARARTMVSCMEHPEILFTAVFMKTNGGY